MNKFSVIIVTFNNEKTISDCIGSILKYEQTAEIIVFDNNSSDKTIETIKKINKNITLIESLTNLGFSRANNIAFEKSTAEYLIFLNPDTEILQKNSLEKLINLLKENPDFGILGPKLTGQDGSVQKSIRNLPTILSAVKEHILGIKGAYDFYLPNCKDLCEVESIVGACMVVKKDTFVKANKFSEKYFLYYEDLDLCRKVKNLRLKIGYISNVEIKHLIGYSTGISVNSINLLHESARIYHGLIDYYLIQIILKLSNFF